MFSTTMVSPFFFELLLENLLQRREADTHHVQTSADRECVLRNLVSRNVGQLRNRKRAEVHAGCGSARLDRVSVIDTRSAGREQPQVAIHAVLVKRNKQVDPVTHIGDLLRAGANGQKSVATTNDGLIGIVGIQIEATPAEDLRENVARRGNTLTGRTCDTNSKGRLHHTLSSSEPPYNAQLTGQAQMFASPARRLIQMSSVPPHGRSI